MKKKILMLCMGCFLVSLTAKAQWVVSDPGNLAQGIINAAKNIVHTSSTATNMANSFQETVKIYRQDKEYYDGLRKVKNLVRDARKVQQTILMVGDITDIYVTSFERMLSDPYFTPEELSAIALGYTKLLELLFNAAALVIDTLRTFFLIVLSILGPVSFAISCWDGFQASLSQWFVRYISIYLWLPVSDLFSSVLARIQILMLQRDIEQLSDPDFIPDSSNGV